jgi:hypothetical protein
MEEDLCERWKVEWLPEVFKGAIKVIVVTLILIFCGRV